MTLMVTLCDALLQTLGEVVTVRTADTLGHVLGEGVTLPREVALGLGVVPAVGV